MGNYIGRDVQYGLFDTQVLTPNSVLTTFNLTYKVSSAASILVVNAGQTLQPTVDYSLASGGTQIAFSSAPATGSSLFILYLGKELSSYADISVADLVAAGTTNADAVATTSLRNSVTGADGAKGIIVDSNVLVAGASMVIANVSTAILKVYPPTGLAFYNKATNAAVSVAAASVLVVYRLGSNYMAVIQTAA